MLFSSPALHIPKSAFRARTDRIAAQKRMQVKAKFPMIDTFPHGSPLGGFGAGTFARNMYGDFAIWHLINGKHIYEPVRGCNFAIYQKHKNKTYATALNHNPYGVFSSWQYLAHKNQSTYAAQYPKSWYQHTQFPATVTIEQFSPILPHNYTDTSYPVACFMVQLENKTPDIVETSVLLSWENMVGWTAQHKTGAKGATDYGFNRTRQYRTNQRMEAYDYKGIVFTGQDNANPEALNGEFCIAAREIEGAKVYFCTTFDSAGDGHEAWESFSINGTLKDSVRPDLPNVAGALAVKIMLNPGQRVTIPLTIAWDIPLCNQGKTQRYYTRFYNQPVNNAFTIATQALKNMEKYSTDIAQWQETWNKKDLPPEIIGAGFNELYYLADGGTIWDAETGRFSYLECYDYYFYETLDVRYYGAYPLAIFWPEIEKAIMRDFVRTVNVEHRGLIDYNVSATTTDKNSVAGDKSQQFIQRDQRKHKGAVPHDIGAPSEDVWNMLNAYTWQNANRWKDLNSKFILMLYRAYYYAGKKDRGFLQESWPALVSAMAYLDTLDKDGDHLPENEAFPDQTFDNWLMRGTSAYCGILRLASYQVGIQIADILEQREIAREWRLHLKKAKDSLEKKLWNGSYYNYDQHSTDIMAAQLMGQWYLDQMHLPAVIDETHIASVFKTVFSANFKKILHGSLGVVNGRTTQGTEVSCSQGNDIWVGINYALAAHLLTQGWHKEAIAILQAIVKITYTRGFQFRTPESWDKNEKFMATMYMRPGAIWAALDAAPTKTN